MIAGEESTKYTKYIYFTIYNIYIHTFVYFWKFEKNTYVGVF
jgi:hypothetical protein